MKIISRITGFLGYLDMFGQPISFYIKGNTTYKTSFGGIITVFISLIIITISINSFNNLINRTNMTSTEQTIYELNPPYLNLTQQNFMFSIGAYDKSMTLNKSILSFSAYLISVNRTNGQQDILAPILLRPYQYNKDYNDLNNNKNQLNLENFLCPENISYPIYDSNVNPIFQYIQITVDSCVNGTNPYITCASQEYIDNYLKNIPFFLAKLLFINNVVDLQNYKNPFKNFIDLQYLTLDPSHSLYYSASLYIRSNQISSYDDIFGISSSNTYNFITYEKEKQDFTFLSPKNTTKYGNFLLVSGNYRKYYTRSYDDVMSVLSYIGGISSLITTFAGVIVGFYNSYKYKMRMFNKLYDFDLKEQTTTTNKNYKINLIKLNMSNGSSSRVHIDPQFNNSIVKKQFDKMNKSRIRLAFTIREWCHFIFCYCTSKLTKAKIILFSLADKQLTQDMDIIRLINRIRDIDKLKNILLYPDKLKIFEFIPPPIISNENDEESQPEILKYGRKKIRTKSKSKNNISLKKTIKIYQNLDEYHKFSDSYSKIRNGNDAINQNILDYLDREIKQIFEYIGESKNSPKSHGIHPKIEEFTRNIDNSNDSITNRIYNNNNKQNIEAKQVNTSTISLIQDSNNKKPNIFTKENLEEKSPSKISQDSSIIQLDNGVDKKHESMQYELQYQQLDNFNSLNMPIQQKK